MATPYRSTRAIARLARFISMCHGRIVPEGDFGSDVEGIKPVLFDVGKDERKMEEALGYCRKELADKGTILYDLEIPPQLKTIVEKHELRAGGSWDCHEARNFFGWEADNVVAVISGGYTLEQITRARTRLIVILVEGTGYAETEEYFQRARDVGLVFTIDKEGREERRESYGYSSYFTEMKAEKKPKRKATRSYIEDYSDHRYDMFHLGF